MFIRSIVSAKLLPGALLLLVTLITQSCGFQLRGSQEVSQEVSPLYMQQNSAFELARELKLLLASNKITVTNHPTKAKSQLILLNESRDRRVLSVDGNGRVREYLLTYTANFYIRFDKVDGVNAEDVNAKQMTDSVSTSRTLLFDPEVVLATTNEAEILYEDMRRHVAHLILLKLEARVLNNASSADSANIDSTSINSTADDSSSINSTDNRTGSVTQPETTER